MTQKGNFASKAGHAQIKIEPVPQGPAEFRSMYGLAGCTIDRLVYNQPIFFFSWTIRAPGYSQQHWSLYSAIRKGSLVEEYNSSVGVISPSTSKRVDRQIFFLFNLLAKQKRWVLHGQNKDNAS